MVIRHEVLTSTDVNTHLGLVRLDRRGLVRNMVDFERPQDILKVPGFLNAEVFPPIGVAPGTAVRPEDEERNTNPTEDEYWRIIQRLEELPSNLNSEGFVDIEVLNRTLREKKMKVLTGPKRKEITLRRRSESVQHSD